VRIEEDLQAVALGARRELGLASLAGGQREPVTPFRLLDLLGSGSARRGDHGNRACLADVNERVGVEIAEALDAAAFGLVGEIRRADLADPQRETVMELRLLRLVAALCRGAEGRE